MASTHSFIFCSYLLVVPFLVGFSSSRYTGGHSSLLLFYVINWRGKSKWIKTVGVYSMGFKVPTHSEEIGDPLDMHSVNSDVSPY